MPATTITYEQPLNESIRLCLRLEYLFQKIKNYIDDDSSWSSRVTLETVLEILNVIDRPDLKTKIVKTLAFYASALNFYMIKSNPDEIDGKKLHRLSTQLDQIIEQLHTRGRFGQKLRDNEFIMTIQQRMTTSGGTCAFYVPSYHLWLQQSSKERIKQLNDFMDDFGELQSTVAFLLRLVRESSTSESVTAKNGFYQQDFDNKVTYQMVRITLPVQQGIFPEVSLGKHRLSIHFFMLQAIEKPLQVKKDIKFDLACCGA